MDPVQGIALVVSVSITVVAVTLFVRAIRQILGVVRLGQPTSRTDHPGARWATLAKESLLHTRMLQWTWVGAAHWFVFVGFGLLFFTLLTAFGQLVDPRFALPLIGHFFAWEWLTEVVTVLMLVAIVGLISYRATRPRERVRGARGRFFGSSMWQGYFVEAVILGVGLCIVVLRGLEYALFATSDQHVENATAFHFPLTFWLGQAFSGLSTTTLERLVWVVAALKIVISFTWMVTIALVPTMGVAWHRFTVWFNIWFKRESSGAPALGAAKPLTSGGRPVGLAELEELDETARLGVGAVEDLSWKGMLDLTSCTECGRCQSQCPAWNTEKPLSPKLLITALRDHAFAKAPYLEAADREAALARGGDTLVREAERPLVGDTGDDWFYLPENGSAVIDPDVLWSCTTCGACVQQCPVDIEHVDHILDMRRYQLLVESNFPAELSGLFRGLENKGNPWNMTPTARLEWAQGLDFDVPVVGEDVSSLDEVEWLFWVGCAGAYEDRAKKTTRAVAELLHTAGVSFAVLGNGETCTGDPARRSGNEFVFLGLAAQNVETLREARARKVVATCAHCFNTLKNEYSSLGIELEVVHHTQLLNRLVRDGRLTPVARNGGAPSRSVTYHDPCYLGRHNQVYSPPRELLAVLPDTSYVEMERSAERSFCCGAGGARMWMEERIGERINANRTAEAVATGAEQIAVGCPFCRVMLSDGLTAAQASGTARDEVEVLDVAQMLLAAVRPGTAPAPAPSAPSARSAAPVETKAEPEPGDVTVTPSTVTATEDVGPLATASGGSSLFDVPAPAEQPAESAAAPGSLFDVPAPDTAGAPTSATPGSLFDVPTPEPTPSPPAASSRSLFDVPSAPEADTAADVPAVVPGSLFDVPDRDRATEPPPATETITEAVGAAPSTPTAAGSEAPAYHEPVSGLDIDALGSLFDVPGPVAATAAGATPAGGTAAGGTTAGARSEPPAVRSLFDVAAAAPEPRTAPEAAAALDTPPAPRSLFEPPPPEPRAEASAPPVPSGHANAPVAAGAAGHQPRTDLDLDALESLFAVPAPATERTMRTEPAQRTEPAEQRQPVPEPLEHSPAAPAPPAAPVAAAEPAAEPVQQSPPRPAGLFDSPAPEAAPRPADRSPDGSPDPPPAQPADPVQRQSVPDAARHQPRTDVDIESLGSLFDL